jgi:tetratricopeptide (TPR) repeat protein
VERPEPHGSEEPQASPEPADRESAYELLQRGNALVRRRHHAQAAIVLERAAAQEPRKGSILEPLGRAYHHSGQYELARATFETLLEVDPSAHWAHFALAESLRKLGRTGESRTHLRLAVALSPRSELYRRALARLDLVHPPKPADQGEPRADPGRRAEDPG